MSRILIYEPRSNGGLYSKELSDAGHTVVLCSHREALFEALAERRPDVVVYVLSELAIDLGVLTVLRRIAPKLPIIILGGPADLEARRSVQILRPAYYGVIPLDPSELRDAVRGALDRDRTVSS